MDRSNRASILTRLATKLRQSGSWCGETHMQKAVYLLQDLLDVPMDFQFILYRHGPFSFDLRDELTSLRADELLVLESQAPPYGPRLAATALADKREKACSKTLDAYKKHIAFVAKALGPRTVVELEQLATALYVTKHRAKEHDGTVASRAECLHRLKPHIPTVTAAKAIEEVDRLGTQARAIK